jgi:hypothetical protein
MPRAPILCNRARPGSRPAQRFSSRIALSATASTAAAEQRSARAALLAYGLLHELRQGLHQRKCFLLPGSLREGGEANQVGEQNRDLPAFRFHALSSRLTGLGRLAHEDGRN